MGLLTIEDTDGHCSFLVHVEFCSESDTVCGSLHSAGTGTLARYLLSVLDASFEERSIRLMASCVSANGFVRVSNLSLIVVLGVVHYRNFSTHLACFRSHSDFTSFGIVYKVAECPM